MKVKKKKVDHSHRIDEFNKFACTHKFYSQSTGMVDETFYVDMDGQMMVNLKCEASYADLVQAWQVHNK